MTMTRLDDTTTEAAGNQAAGLPRLLPLVPGLPEDLRAHLARHGRPPYENKGHIIQAVQQAGLTGRGGAAFPVHRKLAIVAAAPGRKVIVANGAESEPASHKDALLLRAAPNLVLDGLQLAAEAIGASDAHLFLHPGVSPEITRALAQRQAAGLDRLAVTITEAPPRFLAGQESALVSRLAGGPAIPTFTPPRVTERGLGGAPTLVQNVETLAHLALIARYGPRWFRTLGTKNEPGSMLATVHTGHGAQVIEAELGIALRNLIPAAQDSQAVLIGGFHGAWLPISAVPNLTLDNAALQPYGAAVGAGVIAALPADRCGLTESARVVHYLATESAGQCGPCLNGLPRMAAALGVLAGSGHHSQVRKDLERWAGLVTGRGACNHPDGTVRFVRSALTVFGPEISLHARGHCSAPNRGAANRRPFLPLPNDLPTSEEDWI